MSSVDQKFSCMLLTYIFVLLTIVIPSISGAIDKRVITTLKYSKNRVKPTIVNGKLATPGALPYLVSIKQRVKSNDTQNEKWKNFCGGSIVSPNRVLTAAHCFDSKKYKNATNLRQVRLVAGVTSNVMILGVNVTDYPSDAQWRKIKKLVVHEHYDFPVADIAMIFVDREWNFTDEVNFVEPARSNTDYWTSCTAAGFGKVGHAMRDNYSKALLVARVDVMPDWQCSLVWELNMKTFICSAAVLADVARGDSGGPLTCDLMRRSNPFPEAEVLAGIVTGKNFDKTTLYTRVSAYHGWISKANNAGDLPLSNPIVMCWLVLIKFI